MTTPTTTPPPVRREGNKTYVWVTVTDYYIQHGEALSLRRCPLALALRARLPHLAEGVRVGSVGAWIYGRSLRTQGFERWLIDTLYRYDTRREMYPFSVLLVLEDTTA